MSLVLWEEGATQAQKDEAHNILDALTTAYPLHPWGVRVYEGGFFIRHLDFPKSWGMNCKTRSVDYSSSAFKAQVIRMAGEWLERANIKRGVYDPDQPSYRVEGVPEKHQPGQTLPDTMTLTVDSGELREEPRPQVFREENGN